jgi:hypothetical protein
LTVTVDVGRKTLLHDASFTFPARVRRPDKPSGDGNATLITMPGATPSARFRGTATSIRN